METEVPQEEVKKKRKPSTRKKTNTPRPNRNGSNSKASTRLKELWADPVWAAAMREKMAANAAKRKGKTGSRLNIPDGMRKEEAHANWAQGHVEAKEIVATMIKNGVVDGEDERATEALAFNITVLRGDFAIRERLAAASKVLEYTKSKPVAKSEVTLNKAEDWLAQVAASENDESSEAEPDTDA